MTVAPRFLPEHSRHCSYSGEICRRFRKIVVNDRESPRITEERREFVKDATNKRKSPRIFEGCGE
jgi:hypothetical protein